MKDKFLQEKQIVASNTSNHGKQELFAEDLDSIAGGSQVEVNNTVEGNDGSVNIGHTVVINM